MATDLATRRAVLALGATAALIPFFPALAKGGSVLSLLGDASDKALDKLAQPGAFYADKAIRILLPGGKAVSGLMNLGAKAGLTDGLVKSINDAAGLAAAEAKPIFRSAINNIKLTDMPGIATKGDGGTRYLEKSAGGDLREKIEPLIASALGKVGAFDQLDKLNKAGAIAATLGLTRDRLTDSVSDQALKGIFNYLGKEESALRKNPLKLLGG